MNENSSSSSVGKENSAWYVAQEGEHKLTRAPQTVVEKQNPCSLYPHNSQGPTRSSHTRKQYIERTKDWKSESWKVGQKK